MAKEILQEKEAIQLLIDNNTSKLSQLLEEVGKDNPAAALDMFLKLLAYAYPKND